MYINSDPGGGVKSDGNNGLRWRNVDEEEERSTRREVEEQQEGPSERGGC